MDTRARPPAPHVEPCAGSCSVRRKELTKREHPMPRLRLKDYLVIAGGILLVALSLSFAHVNPVDSAGSAPVMVVNTPLPVTLQGTGSISGTVAATQSGTWNVGITGTPAVNLANPADIAKAEGIQHPYQKELDCDWPNDN